MPGNYSITTRAAGSILTAVIYMTDHQVHLTFNTPGGIDDASGDATAMQATADAGELGSESLATDLLGELQRLRFCIKEMKGTTYWYETAGNSLTGAQGANVASAAALPLPAAPAQFAVVTGAVTITSLATSAAGRRVTYQFQSALNIVHSSALKLPYGKIYRTVADEMITFLSLGSGNYILESRSGPTDPPGTVKDHVNSAAAPDGHVLAYNQALSCTAYEGLFTEQLAFTTDYVYPSAVGTITVDTGTEVITCSGAHGLAIGDVVHFANSGGALPTGIATKTKYYVLTVPLSTTFTISATRGGSTLDISGAGSGTNSLYNTFTCVDTRGRHRITKDNLGGSSANRVTATAADNVGQNGGEETHTLTASEMPAHDHGVAGSYAMGSGGQANSVGGGGSVSSVTNVISSAGSGGAHNILTPYITVATIVRV